ncbi:MAG: LemA family protein, partial [Sphaerochaeta sp.]|nr:LemA family protein [Sphaerochaeta sp.]
MTILYILIGVVILIGLYVVSVYNKYVRLRNQGEEAESAIDAHLKQRYDLVPNLVETVKGYAKHEEKTLTAVIEARNKAINATGLEYKDSADKAFSSTLKSLFALSEAYPDLKANQGFLDLQAQLQ